MTAALVVVRAGPLTTVQDLGRPGHAALGVGPSGAADVASHRAANAAVGNAASAATLEVTFGGLELEARDDVVVAVAGAPCSGVDVGVPIDVRDGARLRLGRPVTGLRTYVAVRGGIDAAPVLSSRSTDVLAGLGPAVVRDGAVLAVGTETDGDAAAVESPPILLTDPIDVVALPGANPARDAEAWRALDGVTYTVTPASNRIGVRLSGAALPGPRGDGATEGLVPGSVQVPQDGQPIVMLADHPVTGGYPVVAVLRDEDVRLVAQARPGVRLRFRTAAPEDGSS